MLNVLINLSICISLIILLVTFYKFFKHFVVRFLSISYLRVGITAKSIPIAGGIEIRNHIAFE